MTSMSGSSAPSVVEAWQWITQILPPAWVQPAVLVVSFLLLIGLLFGTLERIASFMQRVVKIRAKPKPEELPRQIAEPIKPKVSFWMAPVDKTKRPTRSSNSIPIITVAAMKGGVGKTTLTANLAAYLDRQNKRVLLIDLDYQGSLSHMLTSAANISKKSSAVDELISGEMSPHLLMQKVESLGSALPNTKLLTCYYQFSDKETEVMIDWACKTRQGAHADEIRFRIEALLHDPVVQEAFDIVLIDAPPRFSTGAMNALCASTHVIIPTVLDVMSAEAAVYFSQDVAAMRQDLFPSLELIGVVPSMTYQNERFTKREEELIDYLNDSLRKYWGVQKVVLAKAAIPRKNALGNVAGKDIGYLDAGTKKDTAEVRKIFDRVGLSILEKLK